MSHYITRFIFQLLKKKIPIIFYIFIKRLLKVTYFSISQTPLIKFLEELI